MFSNCAVRTRSQIWQVYTLFSKVKYIQQIKHKSTPLFHIVHIFVSRACAALCNCVTSLRFLTLRVCTAHTCRLIHKTSVWGFFWLADDTPRRITRCGVLANGNLQWFSWLHLHMHKPGQAHTHTRRRFQQSWLGNTSAALVCSSIQTWLELMHREIVRETLRFSEAVTSLCKQRASPCALQADNGVCWSHFADGRRRRRSEMMLWATRRCDKRRSQGTVQARVSSPSSFGLQRHAAAQKSWGYCPQNKIYVALQLKKKKIK